jgi:hypothetical protein
VDRSETRAPAILVDEFHARQLEGAPNNVLSSAVRLAAITFKLVDGHYPHAGMVCQHLLIPAEQPPSPIARNRRSPER